MLAMARGLATDPALLLLDELSMGLAPIIVEELYEIVAADRPRRASRSSWSSSSPARCSASPTTRRSWCTAGSPPCGSPAELEDQLSTCLPGWFNMIESTHRVAEFKAEVADMRLADPALSRDRDVAVTPRRSRCWLIIGPLLGLVGYLLSHGTTDPLQQRDAIVGAAQRGVARVVGGALYVRYSMAGFLRFGWPGSPTSRRRRPTAWSMPSSRRRPTAPWPIGSSLDPGSTRI